MPAVYDTGAHGGLLQAGAYSMSRLPQVQRSWVQANIRAAVGAMQDAAYRAVAYYIERIKAEGAVDTGHMMRAFEVTRTDDGAVVTNAAVYFPVMDEGRRAGARRPPFDAILQWVLRKRLVRVTERKRGKVRVTRPQRHQVAASDSLLAEAKSMAWAIRTLIARRGTRPREIAAGWANRSAVENFIAEAMLRAMRTRRPVR